MAIRKSHTHSVRSDDPIHLSANQPSLSNHLSNRLGTKDGTASFRANSTLAPPFADDGSTVLARVIFVIGIAEVNAIVRSIMRTPIAMNPDGLKSFATSSPIHVAQSMQTLITMKRGRLGMLHDIYMVLPRLVLKRLAMHFPPK